MSRIDMFVGRVFTGPVTAIVNYQSRLNLACSPSTYQEAIFSFIETGRGHGVVEAVAGAGKSWTIVTGARLISCPGLFLAFNKDIAEALKARLAGTQMKAATVHSHGFACVRRMCSSVRVNDRKYRDMVDAAATAATERGDLRGYGRLSDEQREAIKADGFPARACEQLIDLARLGLLDMDGDPDAFADDLWALADKHDLADFDSVLDSLVCFVVRRCMLSGADNSAEIDYTDMIWLPVVNNWQPARYGWVFVDECQDISKAALALIRKSIRSGGRILAVGDPRQAIYGWAGADSDAFARIVSELNAAVMPLSVCYRCPTSVLDVAREWCPQIEARPGAPMGVVRQATRGEYVAEAREGDMVLCRRNAPLIGLCFELISEGIPAVVRGRDIAKGLVAIVDKLFKAKRVTWEMFDARLDSWEAKQVAAITKRTKDQDRAAQKIDVVRDQAEVLRIIAARSEATSAAGLKQAITDLFSDQRGSVILSSIHRAKGLEAARVAVLEWDRLPYQARQAWQQEQEEHLAYVVVTRATAELIQIPSEVRKPESPAAPEVAQP